MITLFGLDLDVAIHLAMTAAFLPILYAGYMRLRRRARQTSRQRIVSRLDRTDESVLNASRWTLALVFIAGFMFVHFTSELYHGVTKQSALYVTCMFVAAGTNASIGIFISFFPGLIGDLGGSVEAAVRRASWIAGISGVTVAFGGLTYKPGIDWVWYGIPLLFVATMIYFIVLNPRSLLRLFWEVNSSSSFTEDTLVPMK